MTETDLVDSVLKTTLELQRLSANLEAEAVKKLRSLERKLRRLLAGAELDMAGKRELNKLIRSANKAIGASYKQIPEAFHLDRVVIFTSDRTHKTLGMAFNDVVAPTPERLASLSKDVLIDGAPSGAWWEKQSETLQFNFAAEVRKGVLNNETPEQIVSRIVGNGEEAGIMEKARRDTRALVHSSLMTSANQARLETFKKNKKHIKGVRWLATLDGHTCRRCMALDGQSWDLDGVPLDGATVLFQLPPAHWNCRCIASPIPKGIDDIFGTKGLDDRLGVNVRASKDGPTNAVTFEAFLKRQDDEFIDEMLGSVRADLWRENKITLRDLISGTGRELTLDELNAR